MRVGENKAELCRVPEGLVIVFFFSIGDTPYIYKLLLNFTINSYED